VVRSDQIEEINKYLLIFSRISGKLWSEKTPRVEILAIFFHFIQVFFLSFFFFCVSGAGVSFLGLALAMQSLYP
jgi:hypothetical protein